MKATELLKKQHRDVKDLFKRIENTDDEETKIELFEELGANLVAHDAIEREIFYPACEEAMGMTDLLGEALVEHGLVEFSLYLADQAKGEEDFEYKCTALKEVIEHHVVEEEKSFFPKVERALGKARLEELSEEMQERFAEAVEEDFRTPLHANLKQVLAGAIKTGPERRTSRSKRKVSKISKASKTSRRPMRKSA